MTTTPTAWGFLTPWLTDHFPALLANLNPGASPDAWDTLERDIGIALPADFKAFYAVHDGQRESNPTGFFFGLEFLSSARVYQQWQTWKSIIDQMGEKGMQEMSVYSTSLHQAAFRQLTLDSLY